MKKTRFWGLLPILGLYMAFVQPAPAQSAPAGKTLLCIFQYLSAQKEPLACNLNMVHHNPGEPPFDTKYNDPFYLTKIIRLPPSLVERQRIINFLTVLPMRKE
jgi:hypothetical protein